MKLLPSLFLLLFISLTTSGQPQLKIQSTSVNFGTVKEGETVKIFFLLTNTGNEKLLITNCLTGCGCISCLPNREPVEAGNSDTLFMYLDTTYRPGNFSGAVFLQTNAPPPGNYMKLEITGHVRKK